VLELKSVDYTEERPPGGTYRSEDYRRLVAAGSVPAIKINGTILHDSDAIVELLEDLFPKLAMRPNDPLERAFLKSVTRFHDTRLEPALRSLFPLVGNPDKKHNAALAVDAMNGHLERLDRLINPQPYLGGEALSLADCAYATTLFMMEDIASCMNLEIQFSEKIHHWRNALHHTDTVREIINQNRAAIADWIASKLPPA
jgi:glutathione S-transferase/maleylpyruvate isomerase